MFRPTVPSTIRLPLATVALAELRSRIRRLVERRSEVAAHDFLEEMQVLSAKVAIAVRKACETPEVCATLVSRLKQEMLARPLPAPTLQDDSVDLIADHLLLTLLRRQRIRAEGAHRAAASSGVAEQRARACLRKYRIDSRSLLNQVKNSLWTAVMASALLEVGALRVRIEAECSSVERAGIIRTLMEALREQAPTGGPGNELATAAERFATDGLLRALRGEARGGPVVVGGVARA